MLLTLGPSWAAEPTLARLSFWVPPERMQEFGVEYERLVVPFNQKHGIVESQKIGRATIDSVFSRLFEFKTPVEMLEKLRKAGSDPAFLKMSRDLGKIFGTTDTDGGIRNRFNLYRTPAGPGEVVDTGGGKGHWHTYEVIDGLGSSFVTSMIQGEDGSLWLGTWELGGVSRYDGQTWTTFTARDGLASDMVADVLQDRDGNVWFATGWAPEHAGVTRYDGHTWTTFTRKDGLGGDVARTILEDQDGNIWAGTPDGLSRYDGQKWDTFTTQDGLVHNNVQAIAEDRQGNLWIGTVGGVSRLDGSTFTRFAPPNGPAGKYVGDIFVDDEGSIWFGTDRGVSQYDGKTWRTFMKKDGLADNFVGSIAQDREGNLWFGTDGGVSRYDPVAAVEQESPATGTNPWTTFTTKDGLGQNSVYAILQDREGSLWFGTWGGGVSRYDGGTFTSYITSDPMNDVVVAMHQDKLGHLWFGKQGTGVSRFDGSTWKAYSKKDGLLSNIVRSIIEDNEGNLWFSTSGGVSRFDGKTFVNYTVEDGLGEGWVLSSYLDHRGNLWFGTFDGGVSRYDGQSFITFGIDEGLVHNRVYTIAQDQNKVFWFGTYGGVSRFDGHTWRTYSTKDGLAGNTVVSIVKDSQDDLWFATFGGVNRFRDGEWTTFTSRDGLSYTKAGGILEDTTGHLWIGSLGGGVSRFDGQIFQTMTGFDGLSDQVSPGLQDKQGDIWFQGGSSGGVTRYRSPKPAPPPIFVDAVAADRRHGPVTELSIPSSVKLIAFEFHGSSFKTRPDGMVYRYRLKGHDTAWSNTRNLRVEYQDIPVGDYVFEVLAVDRDLTYSEQPATVKLKIFYQPISATVRISDVQVQDVFASFYKTYSEHSIGSVVVTNDAPNPVDAQVSFHIPELMQRPTTMKLRLAGQSEQRVDLNAILDEVILKLQGTQSVQAEVSLSSEVGDQRISVTEPRDIKVHGRGALTWEPLGRAAAFVTPEDKSVASFSRGLYEAYRQQMKGRRVDGNIPAAMLMFEALNGHGIRYTQDASTPYSQARSDQSAVDHIQYPSELLRSRRGDCDDCTVLYCSLLENLNIPTAFVDAPDHILMMFDSGVSVQREFGFSLDPSLYVERAGRFWIPVEVTKLGEGSFLEAWELGAKTCAVLATEGELKITDVRDVWAVYPYALPTIEGELDYPNADQFDQGFQASFNGLQEMRERYVEENYIEPLMMNPDDHFRQMNYAKTRIEAEDYNDAIGLLMPLLKTDYGAEAYYMIGFVNAGKKNYKSAIRFMEKALELEPGNEDYSRSVEFLRTLTEKQNKN